MKSRRLLENSGFSMIEMFFIVTALIVLMGLSFSNMSHYKTRAYNSYALSDYSNLKKVMQIHQLDEGSNFLVWNQQGPMQLPSPIDQANLSNGTTLNYAYYWQFSFFGIDYQYTLFMLRHENGDKAYYFRNLNGQILELVFDV